MADITAAAVKALREKTDLPMMECKKALVKADGDEEKAIEILRDQFKKIQLKRADNETHEGRVFVASNDKEAAMVEIQCESAPVATGEVFGEFGTMLVEQLLNGEGADTPEALMGQNVPGSDQTIQSTYEELVNKIREKIVVKSVQRVPGPVGTYVHHDMKTGVMFQATGDGTDTDVLRGVAMHIAALKPAVTTAEELDQAAMTAERERLVEEAKATGKPDNIIEKIVDGRMKTFCVEQGVLAMQPFAMDEAKTVSQALAEKGFEPKTFTLVAIGG
ncbi:MAG: translation elongation factor Ts [Planctomycetaceae bacterium]